jgi:arabinofuranosyltransferase
MRWVRVAAFAATLGVLLLHAWHYAFLTDDAFISFRYARNLATGHGLVFNPGLEPVEGYTNFLWVLILAGFRWWGAAPEVVAPVLSLALTVVLWILVARRSLAIAGPREPAWVVFLPCAFLAATRSVAVWSSGGLETRLFEVLVVAGTFRVLAEIESDRLRTWASGGLFALASLTRPDGILVGGSVLAVAALWTMRRGRFVARQWIVRTAAFFVPVAAHLLFRLAYYGDWVPNTWHAKVGGRVWWDMGFTYLGAFALEYGLVFLAPLVGLGVASCLRKGDGIVPLAYAAVALPHALHVAAVGGDHFEYRPLDLYFPFLFLLATDGVREGVERTRRTWPSLVLATAGFAGLVWIPLQSHLQYPTDRYRPTFPGGDTDDGAVERYLDPARDPVLRLPGLRRAAELHRGWLRLLTQHAVGIRQEDHRGFTASVVPEGKRIADLIRVGRFPRDVPIVLTSVGAIPYYTDLPTIDRAGLTDATVARAPIAGGVRGMAHDFRNVGDYVRRRGAVLSAVTAGHLLFRADDPDLVTVLASAIGAEIVPAWAEIAPGEILLAHLPSGIEAARARLPGIAPRDFGARSARRAPRARRSRAPCADRLVGRGPRRAHRARPSASPHLRSGGSGAGLRPGAPPRPRPDLRVGRALGGAIRARRSRGGSRRGRPRPRSRPQAGRRPDPDGPRAGTETDPRVGPRGCGGSGSSDTRGLFRGSVLIRSGAHSSYPRNDEGPLDRDAADRAAQVAVAEQSRAFVDIVTDGLVRGEGLVARFAARLDGVEPGPAIPWFSIGAHDCAPVVTGPIRRRGPVLLEEYRVAAQVGPKALKMVFPGPVTFARLAERRSGVPLEAVARDLAAALAEEVSDLAAAGCRIFHLEEPGVCVWPELLPLAAETAATVFGAAPGGATTIFSTSFGDLAHAKETVGDLPGTHVGLDLVEGSGNWDLLPEVPARKGLVLGLFDARSATVEDPDDVLRRLTPYREALTAHDVIVGSHAGLAGLTRDAAFEHLLHARYLVEGFSREWGWGPGARRR